MSYLDKYFGGDKPIVYFSGYGFEDRAIGLLSTIGDKGLFEYAFTIGYPSSFLGNSRHWKQNKALIDDKLAELAKNYERIDISIKQPVEVRQNLRERE